MKKTLLVLLSALSLVGFGQNLVPNGDFETACSGWSNASTAPAVASFTCPNTSDKHGGSNSLRANVTTVGTNAWDVQTLGPAMSLKVGTAYKLTFWAKAASNGSKVRVVVQNTSYTASDYTLSTSWAQYTLNFTPTETSLSIKIHYFEKGEFSFDDFAASTASVIINPSTDALAKCKGKYLGNIIQNTAAGGLNYNAYWNQATSENGSKWASVEGTKGTYDWTTSDYAYNWAKNNNKMFKFHTFVWGSQTPSWVDNASTQTLTASIENYIKACSTHYTPMGGITTIDVLNEPVNTAMPGNMKAALTAGYQADPANANDKNNPYGWVIWPFQLARKYFPNATLLINEYNIEMNWNSCRAPYIAMVNAIKNAPNLTDGKKNLINGVGLQCHGINDLSAANFKSCIDQVWNETGIPIHITEFDSEAKPNETTQKNVFEALIPVAWEHEHVAGITLWGYIQGTTWLTGNGTIGSDGTDSGIIYADGNEKPAMTWLKSYFASKASLSCCPAPAPFASCDGPLATLVSSESSTFVLYPNPTTGLVYLNQSSAWELHSNLGVFIQKGTGKEVDLTNLAAGVYFVKIQHQTFKIVKN